MISSMRMFERMVRPLKARIQLMVGRALLAAVDNSGKTQRLHIQLMADEEISGVERFQDYGVESYPLADAEALAVFLGGNREHGIVVRVHDRRYRPLDLEEGDVQVYSMHGTPHRIWLRKDGGNTVIQIDCAKQVINASKSREITTPETTHTGDYEIDGNEHVTGTIDADGTITSLADVIDAVRSMQADRVIYNKHKHICSAPTVLSGPTDSPQ